MGLSADAEDSITPFSVMVTVIFNNNSVRSINSHKVIRLTFRRFHRKGIIWNSKKNARALCFWNCLCSNYFQFQIMQTIDNSDVFSCSFLWPDSFKKENEKKFAFLRNTAASVTTYEITSFVATHNYFLSIFKWRFCWSICCQFEESSLRGIQCSSG